MVFDEALSANRIESSHHRYVNDIQNHFNHLLQCEQFTIDIDD
jgi:hypothetical protein